MFVPYSFIWAYLFSGEVYERRSFRKNANGYNGESMDHTQAFNLSLTQVLRP